MSEQTITFTSQDQRKSNPKAAMVRAEVRSSRGYANQRAHDLRLGPQPAYVDGSRSHLNRIIMEPPTAPEMRKIVEERRAQRETSRALKSNAGIAVIGIIGFGIEAARIFGQLTPEQQDKALLKAGHAIASEANTTLHGMVWHLDETSGHAHMSFSGYDLDGVPLSSTMKRGMLTRFQDRLAEIMAEHAPGIERGNSKWSRIEAGASYPETLNRSVKELHADLPGEIATKKEVLSTLTSQIPELEARVSEMQTRVDVLENKKKQGELDTEKLKKRLETYQNRLTSRQEELLSVQHDLDRIKAEIDQKQSRLLEIEQTRTKAEKDAARATETLREAEIATKAAQTRKNEEQASLTDLVAQREGLGAVVEKLVEVKAQLQPEVSDLENKKKAISAEIERNTVQASEAQKRVVQAQLEKKALRTQINETQSSLDALRAQRGEIHQDAKELLAAKKKIEADNIELDRQGREMESRVAAVQESLEFLRPALAAADFLQQVSVLDPAEQDSAWDMVITPPRECDPVEYASALRMIDPLFAPEIPVRRSTIADENLETLHECDPEDYWAIVDAVRAEEGAESGIEALAEGAVYLDKTGTIAPSDPDQGYSGVFGKALRWCRNMFEGVKRGVGLALAATRDGISGELTAARANLFNAFEPRVQAALRHLLKAETGHKSPERDRPDPEHSTSEGFEP